MRAWIFKKWPLSRIQMRCFDSKKIFLLLQVAFAIILPNAGSAGCAMDEPKVPQIVASSEAENLFRVGSVHYSRGEYEFAVKRFEKLLEAGGEKKTLATGRFYLAESLVALGKYEKASQHLTKFIEETPNHQRVHQAQYRLGEIALHTGDTKSAARHLQTFLQANPDHPLLEYTIPYLADVELKEGKLDSAQKLFQLSLAKFPQGVLADESRFGLARVLEKTESENEAARFYRMLIHRPDSGRVADSLLQLGKMHFRRQEYDQAIDYLSQFRSKFENNDLIHPVLFWLGRIEFESGNFSGAEEYFLVGLKKKPNPKTKTALRYELARSLAKQNQFPAALMHLEQVLRESLDSDWGDDASLLEIQILQNTSQFDETLTRCGVFKNRFPDSKLLPSVMDAELAARLAMRQFSITQNIAKELIEKNPLSDFSSKPEKQRFAGWQYRLALAQIQQEQQKEADETLSKIDTSVIDQTTQAAIYLAKASAQIKNNRLDDATQSLIRFLDLEKDETIIQQNISNLAAIYAKRNNFQKADFWLRKIQSPNIHITTAIKLGEIAFASEQFSFAADWYTLAAEHADDPKTKSKAMMNYAWSQKELGNISEAIKSIDQLILSHPNSAEAANAIYLKAVLQEKQNKKENAIQAYELIIANHSDNQYYEQALIALSQLYRSTNSVKLTTLQDHFNRLISSPTKSNQDALLYELGWILLDSREFQSAARCFDQIYSDFAKSRYWPDATYQLSALKLKQNEKNEAKLLLQAIINANSEPRIVANSLFQLGKICFDQGEFEEAAQQMQLLTKQFPASNLAISSEYWSAEASYRSNQLQKAKSGFQNLQKYQPAELGPEIGPASLQRCAQISTALKQWENTIEYANQLKQQYPEENHLYVAEYLIGRGHAGMGNFSKARAAYKRSLKNKLSRGTETAALAQWMIGESYFHQGDFEKAIDAYQYTEILHDFPLWQSAALLQAGKCFENLNQIDEAMNCYQRIISQYKELKYAKEASERFGLLRQRVSSNRVSPLRDNR